MKRTRVCLALNVWHLFTAAASIRQSDQTTGGQCGRTVLFLSQLLPQADLKRWMERIAPMVYDWDAIEWVDDLLTYKPDTEEWPLPLARYKERLCSAAGTELVDELWVCHLDGFSHRLLFDVFDSASISIFEDGGYQAVEVDQPWRRVLRTVPAVVRQSLRGTRSAVSVSNRLCRPKLHPQHLKRYRRAYRFLEHEFPMPSPYRQAPILMGNMPILRGLCESVSRQLIPTIPRISGTDIDKRILILSQDFARCGYMSREDEELLTGQILSNLKQAGYQMVWKEHPFTQEPFGPGLQNLLGSDWLHLSTVPDELPVPVLFTQLNCGKCLTGISSGVFYLYHLFGAKPYTYIHLMKDHIVPSGEIDKAIKLMALHAHSVEELYATP